MQTDKAPSTRLAELEARMIHVECALELAEERSVSALRWATLASLSCFLTVAGVAAQLIGWL